MLLKSPNTKFLTDIKIQNSNQHLTNIINILPLTKFKTTNRFVCSLGKDYDYSGQTAKAYPFSLYPPIESLMNRINLELGTNFNSCLVNYYPKGVSVGIGKHKDDVRSLKSDLVVSVSLGGDCTFILSDTYKGTPTEEVKVTLKNGDVFLMAENCQKFYYHSIPYSKPLEDRVSLTFREFI